MLSKLLSIVFVVLCLGKISLGQLPDGDCIASGGPIDYCSQFIYSNCRNSTFIADRRAYNESCSPVSLFWDAPTYNMTILFQSHYSQSYELCIQPVSCTDAFRTLADGREVPVKWDTFTSEPTCFKSEGNGMSTMKFRFDAGARWHCYGTFIRFFYRL